jgi:fatty-acyl-CoA synthase
VVSRAARGLLALGIKPGDRVGIWAPNRQEWIVVQFATARVGAILVNVNPAFQRDELEYVIRQSGMSLLIHAQGFRQTDYGSLIANAKVKLPGLTHTLALEEEWQAFLASGDRLNEADVEKVEESLSFHDPINIQYTSGTTGSPKGATLTHHNLLNNAYLVGHGLGYTSEDRVCIPVPLYHCFGMVLGSLACVSHGACMVFPGEWFQAAAVLEAVEKERCTSLYGVPTMFWALLEESSLERTDCSSLRTGIMAGAPCPVELMKQVVSRLHMPEVAIGYGMTETSPISTLSARDDSLERRVGTVGKVQPHLEISVQVPGSGRLLPCGSTGEFCTRGYSVMRGYWNDEPATRAAIDAAGWMHSGDLAVLDDDGYVHIVGRLKDMIIRGGENISPREIEEVLVTHPDVGEVQVIGVPSKKYGEEVMAWVRPRAGRRLDESGLDAFCRKKLAAYKVPCYWQMTESFPMTVTGKIQKFRLREMAVEVLGRQDDAAAKMA